MPDVLVLSRRYEAVALMTAQRAISLLCAERAHRVPGIDDYDAYLRSPSTRIAIPQVIRVEMDVPRRAREVALTRKNVLQRDGHTCQYCGAVESTKRIARVKGRFTLAGALTIDHIMPRSRGGAHEWLNVVAACFLCNNRKGARTPAEAGFVLRRKPYRPAWIPFLIQRRGTPVPDSWKMFLFQGHSVEQIA